MDKYDCKPTLDDQQVMDFCRNGYIALPSVVSEKVNQQTRDYMDAHSESPEPVEILDEDWFIDGVIKNSSAAKERVGWRDVMHDTNRFPWRR